MRILIIAYEFPPSPSPGALRWQFLARELGRNGHQVDVLAPELPHSTTASTEETGSGVRIHRTFAGPFCGLIAWRSSRKVKRARATRGEEGAHAATAATVWKRKVAAVIQQLLGVFLYPDARAEWWPWAAHALSALLKNSPPDVVISAHEPSTTLQLGMVAARHGIPWIADLGDPVLAPYTPSRWRHRAARLERQVCRMATHVVVTSDAAKRLLIQRHGILEEAVSVMTQGFEDCHPPWEGAATIAGFEPGRLELLYVGRFYPFRRPHQLIATVEALRGVRLTIVAPELPAECAEAVRTSSGKIRFLGQLPHFQAMALQRDADVLISIGNDAMAAQVPGKLYEYLGAGKPIVHLLAKGVADPAREMIDSLNAGWACENDVESLSPLLEMLRASKHNDGFAQARVARQEDASTFGWSRIGSRYSALLNALLAVQASRTQGDRLDETSASPKKNMST